MGGWIWALIPILAICAGMLQSRYKHERRMRALPPAGDPEADRLRAEVRGLKDRIAVLERIVTDRSATLDHEIERLRDR